MVALRERGYVTRDSTTKKYKLGHKLWQLTNNLIDNLDVRHIARPYMEKLNEKYKESVHLIVRSGNYGLYIDKIDSPLPIGLQVHIGKRILLHSSAAGKVILAYTDNKDREQIFKAVGLPKITDNTLDDEKKLQKEHIDILDKGFAWKRGENRHDVYSVSAPIFDLNGKVVATLSIAGPSSRFTESESNEIIQSIVNSTKEISEKLGYPRK